MRASCLYGAGGRHSRSPCSNSDQPLRLRDTNETIASAKKLFSPTTALSKAHRDSTRTAPCRTTYTDNLSYPLREQPSRRQALHRTHRRTNAGVQLVNAEVVQQAKLRANHVEYGDDGKAGRVWLLSARLDGGRARRAVAPSEDIRADDEELVRVQREPGSNELLPPALGLVQLGGGGVRGRGETGVQEDDVVPRGRERAPSLVGDVEFWQ